MFLFLQVRTSEMDLCQNTDFLLTGELFILDIREYKEIKIIILIEKNKNLNNQIRSEIVDEIEVRMKLIKPLEIISNKSIDSRNK